MKTLVAGLALILTSTGCALDRVVGADGSGKENRATALGEKWVNEPVVTSTPSAAEVADKEDFRLPLDHYKRTATEEAVLLSAELVLENQCLRQFGFEPDDMLYDPVRVGNERRYGINVRADVERFGYKADPQQERALRDKRAAAKEPPVEQQQISVGEIIGEYKGIEVPKEGCLGEARRALRGPDYTHRVDLDALSVQRLDYESSVRAQQDSRVRSVFDKWSDCMAESGYVYSDPWEANNDPKWAATLSEAGEHHDHEGAQGEQPSHQEAHERGEEHSHGDPGEEDPEAETVKPSEEELATARGDLSCRAKHNVVGIWHAVEAAYQKELIERNAEFLAEELRRKDETVRKANEVIGR